MSGAAESEKFSLVLFAYKKEGRQFDLHPHGTSLSMSDIHGRLDNYVFNNLTYTGKLQSDNPKYIENFQLYLNGAFVGTSYNFDDGTFSISFDSFKDRLFTECYGYVQLNVSFVFDDCAYSLDTDYIPVMVRKGLQNESVRRMANYVYRNDDELFLNGSSLPKVTSNNKHNHKETLESRIHLLKDIGSMLESCYAYFKANCRFKTTSPAHSDRFEKSARISHKTLQYISRHPNETHKTDSPQGLRIAGRRYLAEGTVTEKTGAAFEIYENKEVLGFIVYLYKNINEMLSEISERISGFSDSPTEKGNYVNSNFYIYECTAAALKQFHSDLGKLSKKYKTLVTSYADALRVAAASVSKPPVPTAIFTSVPQYRQVYNAMLDWFNMGVFNLEKEQYMLSFLRISSLYEVYVLTKLKMYLCNVGFSLISSSQIQYSTHTNMMYENTRCKNCYVFEGNDVTISLYYQPVIFNPDYNERPAVELYRNTSVSLTREYGDERQGVYYTPDFVLKIEKDGLTKYLLADAKFSTLKTVRSYHVAALVYKYLFSISPVNDEDSIAGLLIINGQSEETEDPERYADVLTDIYDKRIERNKIEPYAEILTLTENNENNRENHAGLLRTALTKYIK